MTPENDGIDPGDTDDSDPGPPDDNKFVWTEDMIRFEDDE